MANNTGWAGGRLFSGLGYTAAFNTADLNSLPSGSSVLSSISEFANTTTPDQLAKISFKFTIASSTIAAGASIAFWLANLQLDGTTLGDGRLTAGTQVAYTPPWAPVGVFPIQVGSSVTVLEGDVPPFIIDPVSFALIVQNNIGFSLAASGNTCSIMSYNQALND